MCEAHAYMLQDEKEKLVLEHVDLVELEGEQARLVNIFGEQKTINGRLKFYDNSKGKIVFEPL
jgi:predicted RNA-binding protein